jgi:NAD(P)-dependent dehydrogenase (short-subunit alcohol dehydrogenase family)
MPGQFEGKVVFVTGGASGIGRATALRFATPGACAYSASKHGVVGLTKSAAVAYAQAGIRVNAVCPGLIDTPMTADIPQEFKDPFLAQHPIGRPGAPQEVAEAVVWLCADAASYVTGHAMAIDGAYVAQ